MENLVNTIERARPTFEKFSRNKYLRAMMNGFVAVMPIVIFSSIFMLIAYVPNIFDFYWSDTTVDALLKPYDYTMGFMGLAVAGTVAKSLTDSFNRDLPATKQISTVSTMIASMLSMLILSTDSIENGMTIDYLGSEGLIAAFIGAFLIVNVYNFFIEKNITITLPDEVPGNIASAFEDIMPFSAGILLAYFMDIIIRMFVGTHFAQFVIELFQPLFSVADSYIGLMIIGAAISFFWFIGIHGPSVVLPAVNAIMYRNLDLNQQLVREGERAIHTLTPGTSSFLITFGGTGATFVVPLLFMFLAKSKRNKAVGQAAFIPTAFGVNEPILFGGPLVLNPVFFVPFILAPVANVILFKFFVDVLGMSSFIYQLPWTTPGPLGIIMGTGFDVLSIILAAVILVVDAVIYYPFFKVYDNQILEEELNADEISEEDLNEQSLDEVLASSGKQASTETNVLVLCAGGGTSRQLANALNKGAKEFDVPLKAAGEQYGSHMDMLKSFDLVVLAPQVATNYEDIKQDTDKLGISLVKTGGEQYISLTQNPEGSLKFVFGALNGEE